MKRGFSHHSDIEHACRELRDPKKMRIITAKELYDLNGIIFAAPDKGCHASSSSSSEVIDSGDTPRAIELNKSLNEALSDRFKPTVPVQESTSNEITFDFGAPSPTLKASDDGVGIMHDLRESLLNTGVGTPKTEVPYELNLSLYEYVKFSR